MNTIKKTLVIFLILFVSTDSYAQLIGIIKDAIQKTDKIGVLLEEKNITTSITDALPVAFWLQDLEEYREPVEGCDYSFVLSPGFYRYSVQSYCLKAGTYGPTKGDGYLLTPIKGKQADLVVNILKRSANHPEIAQQDIQRMLWGIIAGAKFTDYDASFQNKVRPLLLNTDIARMSIDVNSLLKNNALNVLPDEVKKAIKFYTDFRSKLTNPNTTYNEIVSMAMLNGVLPEDPFNKYIQKGLWSYIGDGFYAKALPTGYTQTNYYIYKPGKIDVIYDEKNRLKKLYKNGYSVEISYDDTPGGDVISFGTSNYPIWRITSLLFKDAKSGQEYSLNNTGWMVKDEGKLLTSSKNNSSSRPGDPSFEEYNNRVNKTNMALQNMNAYRQEKKLKKLDKDQIKNLLDEYAQHDGLYFAIKLLDSNSNLKWTKNIVAISTDRRNSICSTLAGEENTVFGKQKADIVKNLANPATNGKQRLAISERPTKPVKPCEPEEEIVEDDSEIQPDNFNEYNQELAETCALYSALAYQETRITTKSGDLETFFYTLGKIPQGQPIPTSMLPPKDMIFSEFISHYKELKNSKEIIYFTGKINDDYVKKDDNKPYVLEAQLKYDGYTGITPCKCYHDEDEHNISHTFAYKKISEEEIQLVVILRGTDYVEWRGNMDIWEDGNKPSQRHFSFQNANKKLQDAIDKYIYDTKELRNKNINLLITGHSRGAAVGNLLAVDSNDKKWCRNGKIKNVCAYLFATPNNSTFFSENGYENIFNFCFEDDFVPQIPLDTRFSEWSYGKSGKIYTTNAEQLWKFIGPIPNEEKDFRILEKEYIKLSENRDPSFDKEATERVMKSFSSLAPTVNIYYTEKMKMDCFPGLEYNKTLHDFMRDYVANAAIEKLSSKILTALKQPVIGIGINPCNNVYSIVDYFVDGIGMKKSVNDTHQAFTYYNALKARGFSKNTNETNVQADNSNEYEQEPQSKGKLIFLTHGLNSNGTCFEQTVKSLEQYYNYFNFGLISANNASANNDRSQYVNQLTDEGKNVLVKLEFSAGNLSFNEQFSQMDKMLKEFKGHNADVVFIGHSMGGLASIRYGMYYAKNNPSKKVTIVTVDTPYQPNNYAKFVWEHKTTTKATEWLHKQNRGDAHRDLTGYEDDAGNAALLNLRNDWNQYKKYWNSETAKLYAISVSMYSKNEKRWSEIGDGIVDIPAQQGNFLENQNNVVGKWNEVNYKPTIFGTGISSIGFDITSTVLSGQYFSLLFSDAGGINDMEKPGYHTNTPALPEVIKQIKEIIEEVIETQLPSSLRESSNFMNQSVSKQATKSNISTQGIQLAATKSNVVSTNNPILQELAACKNQQEVLRITRANGLVIGRDSSKGLTNPEKCIIAVFSSNGALLALLDVGSNSRMDLLSNKTVQNPEQFYNRNGYSLWYIQQKNN